MFDVISKYFYWNMALIYRFKNWHRFQSRNAVYLNCVAHIRIATNNPF